MSSATSAPKTQNTFLMQQRCHAPVVATVEAETETETTTRVLVE